MLVPSDLLTLSGKPADHHHGGLQPVPGREARLMFRGRTAPAESGLRCLERIPTQVGKRSPGEEAGSSPVHRRHTGKMTRVWA